MGSLIIQVIEESIATTRKFLVDKECWFKSNNIHVENYNHFVKQEHQNPNWKRGIPRSWMRE